MYVCCVLGLSVIVASTELEFCRDGLVKQGIHIAHHTKEQQLTDDRPSAPADLLMNASHSLVCNNFRFILSKRLNSL